MTNQTPPFHWVTDQSRAWRLAAAIWEQDGALFDAVVAETRDDGPQAVDTLLAALARNLVVRLQLEIGAAALDELIGLELTGCETVDTPSPFVAEDDQ